MSVELIKGNRRKKSNGKQEVVCFIHFKDIEQPEYPFWITKENYEDIGKLMNW
jgi:hypothetical protein